MKIPRSLNEAINLSLNFKKKAAAELAAELGVSENLVYRWCQSEDSPGFADLPLRRLLGVLNATNSNAILDFFEFMRGRVAVKIPRVSITKADESEMVDKYQTLTITAVKALREFLNDPNVTNYHKVDSALKVVMRETTAIDKYCNKKAAGQLELEL